MFNPRPVANSPLSFLRVNSQFRSRKPVDVEFAAMTGGKCRVQKRGDGESEPGREEEVGGDW